VSFQHIENARDDLGSNLQELEQRVKSVTDWRQQFQNNPMMMVGLAFGGGVFLATMAGGRRNRLSAMSTTSTVPLTSESSGRALAPRAVANREKQQVLETWDNIKGALVGVAASRLKSFLGESIPGFEEQLRKTEVDSTQSSQNRPASSMPGSASFAR
jgi:hypothetical protein